MMEIARTDIHVSQVNVLTPAILAMTIVIPVHRVVLGTVDVLMSVRVLILVSKIVIPVHHAPVVILGV